MVLLAASSWLLSGIFWAALRWCPCIRCPLHSSPPTLASSPKQAKQAVLVTPQAVTPATLHSLHTKLLPRTVRSGWGSPPQPPGPTRDTILSPTAVQPPVLPAGSGAAAHKPPTAQNALRAAPLTSSWPHPSPGTVPSPWWRRTGHRAAADTGSHPPAGRHAAAQRQPARQRRASGGQSSLYLQRHLLGHD